MKLFTISFRLDTRFSGAADQSSTQVQERSSFVGQEMWPCGGSEILMWYFVILGKKVESKFDTGGICDWYEK